MEINSSQIDAGESTRGRVVVSEDGNVRGHFQSQGVSDVEDTQCCLVIVGEDRGWSIN